MSYRIAENEDPERALHRIAHEQIDAALRDLADPRINVHEKVHCARKRSKKLRNLLRLFRPHLGKTYRTENKVIREAARELSEPRDAAARVELVDSLLKDEEWDPHLATRLQAWREKLAARSERFSLERDAGGLLANFGEALRRLDARVSGWHVSDCKAKDSFLRGLISTYGRARKAMRAAERRGTPERFHEWRKRAKTHCHHLRLVRKLWPRMLKARAAELGRLSDLLGDDHDLALFEELLRATFEDDGSAMSSPQLLRGLESKRATFRSEALRLGRRLFAEKPRTLKRHFARLGEAMRA